MFHPLYTDLPRPRQFTNPFDYQADEIVKLAAKELCEYLTSRTEWAEELSRGKMFGVLIVEREDGALGYLSAFSGNLDGQTTHPFFVPPVFDLHALDSFFRVEEARISDINSEVKSIETSDEFLSLLSALEQCRRESSAEITAYREFASEQKLERDTLRKSAVNEDVAKQLIKDSQFQKAELKRIETRCREAISQHESALLPYTQRVLELKNIRQKLSQDLQNRLFESYEILNHKGERSSLLEIFKTYRDAPPPAGAGECAAPKMLHYAFANGLRLVAMGEFWWGHSPLGEVRHHGEFYPSCKGKCEPILGYMLNGVDLKPNESDYSIKRDLRVLYRDEWLAVVDKPSGMLSVEGRVVCPSVEAQLPLLFPQSPDAKVVHRLDMDTSGLLLISLTPKTYSDLQQQFSHRRVQKEYVALLDGEILSDSGEVNLPLSADYEQRPRQRVDHLHGKEAHTTYRVISREGGRTLISMSPHTGRTHQLRLHAAHKEGLGVPIVGDRLYGHPSKRLMLQAVKISFTHPHTGERVSFEAQREI